MAGARIPPHAFTVAPTPPPDIDVAAWERSIDTIRAWKPAGLGLTHFGPAEDADAQLDACLEALRGQVELEAEHDEARFVAAMEARVSEGCGPDAATMIQATPLDQLHMGLARWRKKFGGA
jgi:CubicO group peptidase (beta-lactamase class C family)